MGICFCQWIYWECCNLLLHLPANELSRLFWSERETGNTGVAVTEMASPGPWEGGTQPWAFFHKSSWMQVSREWQKVQVMPLTHSVASGCIFVMCFSTEKRKSGTQLTAIPNPFQENENTSLFLCSVLSRPLTAHPLCHRYGHWPSWAHLTFCIFCGSGERDLGPSLWKQSDCSTKSTEIALKEMKTGLGLTFYSQGRRKAWSVTSWKWLDLQVLEWGVLF